MKQIGICLPSYNESENIVQLINKILETGNNIIICVVDDNSPDNTYDLINQKFSNNENIKIIKRESKDGYFIMKGIRTKSDIEAGIGYSNIIGGDGVFGNLIGAKCTYAASYFKDSVQILTKCDVDKNKLNVK